MNVSANEVCKIKNTFGKYAYFSGVHFHSHLQDMQAYCIANITFQVYSYRSISVHETTPVIVKRVINVLSFSLGKVP
jgi:hypothetical protein